MDIFFLVGWEVGGIGEGGRLIFNDFGSKVVLFMGCGDTIL